MAPVFSKLPKKDDGNTSGAAASGEHWSAQYRHRLGIGDSQVKMVGLGHWQPPKHGGIKINFSAAMPEPDGDDAIHDVWGGISAVARNSSGDPLAVPIGRMKIGNGDKLGLQLYALKAAGNLAKKPSSNLLQTNQMTAIKQDGS